MGDHAGVVSDGDSGDDVDYTEVTSVSAHFSGFFSEECEGSESICGPWGGVNRRRAHCYPSLI